MAAFWKTKDVSKTEAPKIKTFVGTLTIRFKNRESVQFATTKWFPQYKESSVLPWKVFIQWYHGCAAGKIDRPFVKHFKTGQTAFSFEDILYYTTDIKEIEK